MSNDDLPPETRIMELLHELGIDKAHFASGRPEDIGGLLATYPEVVASLTLDGPVALEVPQALQPRVMVIGGEFGPRGNNVARTFPRLKGARKLTLDGYYQTAWSDTVADRAQEIAPAMLDFLAAMSDQEPLPNSPEMLAGEVAGITYRVEGSGPPLILLPLTLSPSQWDPIVPALAAHYCTIRLGGPFLGAVAMLERRGNSPGYRRMLGTLVDLLEIKPRDRVLEVGCGTGVIDRWLARRSGNATAITAVDINRYLMSEARSLAEQEGLGSIIEFREGNAEELPFADRTFDAAFSVTVFEEGDATQMLSEIVRVTKSGGRVGVIVRGTDLPFWINVDVSPELKAKAHGGQSGGMTPEGCADASLYSRFHAAGLVDVTGFPAWALTAQNETVKEQGQRRLEAEELSLWNDAVTRGEREGTFFVANPYHCAAGTKP